MHLSDWVTLNAMIDWLAHGTWQLSWWQIVLFTLAVTHITMVSVTVYLHRHQAHRALDLHPIASHFFRFWLWLTTGQVTKEWTAIHRKHHAKCEKAEDPHSPHVHGIKTVLFRGAELYRAESKNLDTMARFGHGTPDDWIERKIYTGLSWQGVVLMLAIDLTLFGAAGLSVWAVQMVWTPIMAAGIYQVMPMSEAIQEIVLEGGNALQIAEVAQKAGINDLRKSALLKVRNGITSLAEINRVTKD